jgi:hypothetical protein
MNEGVAPPEGIAQVARDAYEASFHGGSQVEPIAGLWVALHGLVVGDAELREDALARMEHETLVLLAAQAEVEVLIAGSAAGQHDYNGVYLVAADKGDDELCASIGANVERLAAAEWEPPWSDEEEGDAA